MNVCLRALERCAFQFLRRVTDGFSLLRRTFVAARVCAHLEQRRCSLALAKWKPSNCVHRKRSRHPEKTFGRSLLETAFFHLPVLDDFFVESFFARKGRALPRRSHRGRCSIFQAEPLSPEQLVW